MKLLLLPGMEGSGKLFDPLLRALDSSIEPHVVGYPTNIEQSYENLLTRIPLPTGDFAVLGESFSGPLAIRIAAAHPERVHAVILAGSFVRNPSRMPRFAGPVIADWLFAPRLQRIALWLSGACRAARAQILEAMATVPPEAMVARTRTVLAVDVRRDLRRVSAPILYLRGKHDLVVTLRSFREIQAIAPTTKLIELDANHFVLQQRPAEAAHAIHAFLSQSSANRPAIG